MPTSRVLLCAAFCWLALLLPLRAANNILLIIADDLGADSFPLTAAVGSSVPPMPNLTALKNSGVLFTNARSHPTCSPSRASMLTGRHPFRTGIGTALTGATSPQLAASEFTLPDAFAANAGLGYSLAMFGKWHLNSGAGSNDTPRTIGGWPDFAGTIIGALPDYSSWTKVTNGVGTATTDYATTDVADDVVAWIGSRGAAPWFAWVAFNSPHAPFHFPPNNLHSYDAAAATNRNYYESMCEALDTEIGRILAGVNLATTTVIFIGDNGTPANVIQPPYTSAHAKETLYDGGTRVPLIIAGAGVASPNRTSTAPVHCVDLYATVLELAGINVSATQPTANPIDSRSLLPILANTTDGPRYAFSQQFGTGLATNISGRAITDGAGYKLIQFDDGHEEFFRVTTDVNEATNLMGATISAADQAAYAALKLQLAGFQGDSTPNHPLLHSWFTENSGEYARIYPTITDMLNGNAVSTWSRGAGVQTSPTYAGVHQIDYSSNWVYIHTTGLGSHVMGPWYNDVAKTLLFPNYPSNTAVTYRFPRTPVIPTSKTLFGLGAVGYFVDGVAMFDIRDAFTWNGTTEVQGSGLWNRDAYVNEGISFDNAGAHQAGNNHHYHASPRALRHLLGDNVSFNPATNTYTEGATPSRHSPILGWTRDGLPVYGPYGYSDPLNPASGVRRMISGFALRSGSVSTLRQSLPAWAARAYNRSGTLAAGEYGPSDGTTYPLGRYLEDNEYRGDLGQTLGVDFDLNEYNVRYCVTPEYPGGTWAYFICIAANGTPVFPYLVGRSYYGDPIGGAVTSIAEPVATSFLGGPFKAESARSTSWVPSAGDVSFFWNAVEGATYRVEATSDFVTWSNAATGVTATGNDLVGITEVSAARDFTRRFYRPVRTSLASYDRTGFAGTVVSSSPPVGGGANTVTPNSGNRGTTVPVVIELPLPLPPANVGITSITFGSGTGVTVSGTVRYSQTLITTNFVIGSGASTGARNVVVTFNGGVGRTITNGFTVQ